MPHPVLDAAVRFRRQVLANEQAAADRLVAAYRRAYGRLRTNIEALEQQIAGMETRPHATEIKRLAVLRSLQEQTIDELRRFAVYADTEIANAAANMIALGGQHARGYVAAYSRQLAARFDMLPVESVETLLGFLADDSPLHDALVARLGPALAQRMGNVLVDGIATGMGPRQVAALARRELGVGLTWALNTARTAQLWTYREASRQNYMANSDVVGGWTWLSALDSRTCSCCLSKHGSRHSVDETLNGHHSCRCTMVPTLQPAIARRLGLSDPEVEPGEQWFRRQPEAAQRRQMGPGMFEAWKAGAVAFEQLAHPYEDGVYGTMLREPSMRELGVEAYYVR